MDDLSRLFDTLFPVLIFIIWIIISVAASTKKKRSGVPPKTGSPYQKGGTAGKPVERKKGAMDELKKTLETIFQEMGVPSPAELPTPPYEKEETEEKTEPAKAPKQVVLPKKQPKSEKLTIAKQMEPLPEAGPGMKVTQDELRNAVIWSEILSAPVSIRETE
ncbi:MAG: hypothetical protein GX556_07890 [Fibrobacter sp.]|nr:hypothetical protein [Fibrobacter sp.]